MFSQVAAQTGVNHEQTRAAMTGMENTRRILKSELETISPEKRLFNGKLPQTIESCEMRRLPAYKRLLTVNPESRLPFRYPSACTNYQLFTAGLRD